MPVIEYETCCSAITQERWDQLMKGARKTSYRNLVKLVKQHCPYMYEALALGFPNPWADYAKRTPTHFVLVHSATEYFFRIIQT